MKYEEQERRRRELRAEDPHGRRSGSDIDRIVLGEHIDDQIDSMSDFPDEAYALKELLRDMMSYVRGAA